MVYKTLMYETDEDNVMSGKEIAEYLKINYGISAERRSIYRDIEEINRALPP